MWAFASRRLRRWMVLAVGVPATAWALDRLSERLEARGGPTTLSQAARVGGDLLHRHERGPAARRREGGPAAPRREGGGQR